MCDWEFDLARRKGVHTQHLELSDANFLHEPAGKKYMAICTTGSTALPSRINQGGCAAAGSMDMAALAPPAPFTPSAAHRLNGYPERASPLPWGGLCFARREEDGRGRWEELPIHFSHFLLLMASPWSCWIELGADKDKTRAV